MKKQNKKYVLVTGGSGFIGSALLRRLVKKYPDDEFINFDDLRAGSHEEAVAELWGHKNYHFMKGAVENREDLLRAFKMYPITDVIHLAAESDVDRSIKDPFNTHEVNVTGTLNLLDLSRGCRFVYVSTDEVYGSLGDDDMPCVESDTQHPSSPYSASKAAAEGYVMAYHKTYDLNAVITRGANTVGPWQDTTKLVPVVMKSILDGKKIPVYGNGQQMREWLPVEAHASGIETAWLHGISGEIYNISTGVTIKNIDLVKLLLDVAGEGDNPDEWIEFVKDRPGHDYRYGINNHKIQRIGWVCPSPEDVWASLMATAVWYLSTSKD